MGERDYDRSLTDDGRAMASQTGRILASLNLSIDRVITSAAARTSETADLVATEISSVATDERRSQSLRVTYEPELYHASGHAFANAATQHAFDDESAVLVVGHNPGIGALMCYWADERLDVSPATLVAFRFDVNSWKNIKANHNKGVKVLAVIQDGMLQKVDATLQHERKG